MSQRRWIETSLLLICLAPSLPNLAQAPPTIEQSLASKGISTSSLTSIRRALQDVRPEVRGLAAAELAEKKDKESIPLIKDALEKASSALEKQNLAAALTTLGDAAGNAALKELCEAETIREDSRIIAADQLADSGDNGCAGAVVNILSSSRDSSVRQGAMAHLLKYRPLVSPTLLPSLQRGLESSLKDEVAEVRRSASECILSLKIYSATDSLRQAISIERDPGTRTQMQRDLQRLEDMQR